MGAFLARQPNGKICRFSTVVDTVTHWNMTEEDYIEMCADRAREQAKRDLETSKYLFQDFEEVKEQFRPANNTREEFLQILREMGDTETQLEDIFQFDEEDEE